MSAPLLQVSHVTARYGVLPVLHDVSLDIHQREIVALIGANGAGKTTLMMTIFGRPRPSHGRILFAGRNITELPAHAIARLGIAQSPEGRRIFPRMTVMENLQMGAIIAGDADTFDSGPRPGLHALSGVEGKARSARRHAFRRRAADARHRPRADGTAEAAAAG